MIKSAEFITSGDVERLHRTGNHRMAILAAYLKGFTRVQSGCLYVLQGRVYAHTNTLCAQITTLEKRIKIQQLALTAQKTPVLHGATLLEFYGIYDRTRAEYDLVCTKQREAGVDRDAHNVDADAWHRSLYRSDDEVVVSYASCPVGAPSSIDGLPKTLHDIHNFRLDIP